MIATIVEPVFCGGILGEGHHAQQTVLQHLLQTHDSIPGSDNVGHLACLWPEVLIVVTNDAITDGIDPTVKIQQIPYRVTIFKAVHPSHSEGDQLWVTG